MKRLSNPFLYLFVLACVSFVLLVSFGEVLWSTTGSVAERHWTEKMFFGICHQLPDRTYSVDGALMAVNTRCFGIFLGILAGWVLLPFMGKYTVDRHWPVILLLLAVTLQVVDYLGNLAELWHNTNHSRALLGVLFGVALSVSVSDLFVKRKPNL
ncbi:DUF2085 domain-containing protein [Rhodohalobacter sp. 8-1]|uniref:DUF2085 domain-containing protein n=1 Tax=Rhodohalobacter sp. 8-1 TaxID=3131972 RepID=UPI0030EE3819